MDKTFLLKIAKGRDKNTSEISMNFAIETNHELIDKLNLGRNEQTCKLCGVSGEFQTWQCFENYIGLKDEFIYFECPECETLQIAETPARIERYYPASYYSFQPPVIEPVRLGAVRDTRMILDVGCGAGNWLCFLATLGCVNLFGCDPFIDRDLTYSNGVKIKKCTLHEMEGQYDVIHLSHSFEHLADPRQAFEDFDRLLKYENGVFVAEPKVEIAMPIFPNAVFGIYGPYWFGVDAPRHFFIHSLKGIRMLAEEYGFKLVEIKYDDSAEQFIFSRMYQFNVPYSQVYQRYEHDEKFAELREQKSIYEILGKAAALNSCSHTVMLTLTRHSGK